MLLSCKNIQEELHDYPIDPVNTIHIELTDNFWLPKIKTIQHVTIQYAFNKCKDEGRLENFLVAGGKLEGETRGAMPFDDTDVYKIIEGASNTLLSSPDKDLENYLDTVISIIKTGQEDDGYLTTWRTINPDNPPANWVKPGKRWEHLESSHELYNSGHLFEAASVHYLATGKKDLLDVAIKNADLLVETFGPGKNQALPGHQIVETGLIKLYRITQNRKYLNLAKYFLDQRGDSTSHKLYGSYSQDHLPVTEQREVVGHAVRAVYMYAGMTDIAAIYNDQEYITAINKLWENMVYKKLYITGGIGARHEGESFGDNYELPNLSAYSETCAAIGSVYWNHRMFLLTGDAKYYDIIERTLYNALIAGISLDGDEFFYPNPLESDGKYKFNHGKCTRQPWFNCSCCPTNLIRFIPSIPGLIYTTNADSLYINLYASNKADIALDVTDVGIIQQTEYPWNGSIYITVNPKETKKFTVKLRIPGWAGNQAVPGTLYTYLNESSDDVIVRVNGEDKEQVYHNGFLDITRNWKKGDKIEIQLPVEIKRVITNEKVRANHNLVALEYGPIVYCAEGVDNNDQLEKIVLPDDAELKIEKRNDLLNGVNIITCEVAVTDPGSSATETAHNLVLVPYYSWSNRGEGTMKVWLPRK